MDNSKIKIKEVSADIAWQLRYEVMYPEHSLAFVKVAGDLEATHLGLSIGEEVVSVLSIFYQGEEVQFRKFCTKEGQQGKGYGTTLLHHFFDRIKSQSGYSRIWCNARLEASGFYLKFDMKLTDHTYFKDGYDFVIMEHIF